MQITHKDKTYQVRPADTGRIALAGFLALSRGEPVDIVLSGGERIEQVRFAEIEAIAEQVIAG